MALHGQVQHAQHLRPGGLNVLADLGHLRVFAANDQQIVYDRPVGLQAGQRQLAHAGAALADSRDSLGQRLARVAQGDLQRVGQRTMKPILQCLQ